MTTNNKPALVYLRGASSQILKNQEELISLQVDGSTFRVVDTVRDVSSGVAGLSRQGLQQLFDALQSQPSIHHVIVWDQARLSRRTTEAEQVIRRLRDMNVEVHYACDGLGSKSEVALLMRMILEMQRRHHGKLIRKAKQERRA